MRNKIDYGIDLGTTNSAIARMENGVPTIKKSDTLKDTFPSCIHFNKKKDIIVGDAAYNILKKERQILLLSLKEQWELLIPMKVLIWKEVLVLKNYLLKL
jgi:molecular chaperone DnaK